MNPTAIQSVLAGLILAAIIWLARSVNAYGNQLTRVEVILTGADGDSGLNGEVKALRKRSHDNTNDIHTLKGNHALLKQRVDRLEPS